VLRVLSTPDGEQSPISARAITYPTSATHQTTANPLLSSVSTANPQAWLQSLTG